MTVPFPPVRSLLKRSRTERPASVGLTPVSQASRIANNFLFWYLGASLVWILGSDSLLNAIGHVVQIPEWIPSAKGICYVFIIALALRRAARVYVEGVERAHKDHIEANLELVRRLALAAEYRDDETGGHNQRIGRFAAIVATELNLDPKFCETLSYAASLHDLGKIGMPDSLLLKPGAFTAAERKAMELHVTLGAEILSGGHDPLVRMSHAVALTHHEKWDGSGYPRQLAGDAIPIEGRIVAVCDVFDALISERPYKHAWPVVDAVAEIVRLRGSHFDPSVVDAFVRCLPMIEATRAEGSLRLRGRSQSFERENLAA